MKLALISPTATMDLAYEHSDGLVLALAHIDDQAYVSKVLELKARGATIYLDNGAFELGQPLATTQLLARAASYDADAIVAPDYPGKPWLHTVLSTLEFRQRADGYNIIGVPQSEPGDIDGWRLGAEAMIREGIDIIGISILACPIAAAPHIGTNDIELCRLFCSGVLASRLGSRRPRLHYLGMGERLDLIQHYHMAESLDTSGPVWAAYNGIDYRKWPRGLYEKPGAVDFNKGVRDLDDVEVIKSNARELRQLAAVAERGHEKWLQQS